MVIYFEWSIHDAFTPREYQEQIFEGFLTVNDLKLRIILIKEGVVREAILACGRYLYRWEGRGMTLYYYGPWLLLSSWYYHGQQSTYVNSTTRSFRRNFPREQGMYGCNYLSFKEVFKVDHPWGVNNRSVPGFADLELRASNVSMFQSHSLIFSALWITAVFKPKPRCLPDSTMDRR